MWPSSTNNEPADAPALLVILGYGKGHGGSAKPEGLWPGKGVLNTAPRGDGGFTGANM